MVDASRAEAGANLTQDFTGLLSSRQWQVLGRSARAHPPLALVLHVAMNCQEQTTASLGGGSLPNPEVSIT